MASHINDHTPEGQLARSLADLHTKFDHLHEKYEALLKKEEEPSKLDAIEVKLDFALVKLDGLAEGQRVLSDMMPEKSVQHLEPAYDAPDQRPEQSNAAGGGQ